MAVWRITTKSRWAFKIPLSTKILLSIPHIQQAQDISCTRTSKAGHITWKQNTSSSVNISSNQNNSAWQIKSQVTKSICIVYMCPETKSLLKSPSFFLFLFFFFTHLVEKCLSKFSLVWTHFVLRYTQCHLLWEATAEMLLNQCSTGWWLGHHQSCWLHPGDYGDWGWWRVISRATDCTLVTTEIEADEESSAEPPTALWWLWRLRLTRSHQQSRRLHSHDYGDWG